MFKLFKKKEKPLKIIIGFSKGKPIIISNIRKKSLVILLFIVPLSSCSTIDTLYDNTTITYNVKKNNINAKTKINKHITIKW